MRVEQKGKAKEGEGAKGFMRPVLFKLDLMPFILQEA